MPQLGAGFYIAYLAFMVLIIASTWKAFTKAGKPGWAAIIPFYNIIVMLEIAGKPAWWLAIMLLVPIANIVFIFKAYMAFARAYGHGGGFGVGLIFLPFVFWPILGFGSAQYVGAAGQQLARAPA